MGFLSDKPYTAVSSTIERLTEEQYDVDDVAEIVDLVEIINIRATGYEEIQLLRCKVSQVQFANPHL